MRAQNETDAPSRAARCIMVGGFLGSGKTTAIARLSELLRRDGQRVGIVTNDPGTELVDTAIYRFKGFATEEVTGGCFCRQVNTLSAALTRLNEAAGADVLIAESAGSCTGLASTASAPLPGMFRDGVAGPLTVLVDPKQAEVFLAAGRGDRFSATLSALYRQQLAEAELLVVSKTDATPASRIARLKTQLEQAAPGAMILPVSARTGDGMEEWLRCLHQPARRRSTARTNVPSPENNLSLGWLNCTLRVSSVRYFESHRVLVDLFSCIQALLQQEGAELVHLKAFLNPGDELNEAAVAHLMHEDDLPELVSTLSEPIQSGELLLNLRAEADPEILHSVVTRALLALMERSPELFLRMEHCEHFRPGRERMAEAVSA